MAASPARSDDPPQLKEILENTKQVTQWKFLGIELGIEASRMQIIAEECHGNIEQCKMEMFVYWLRSDVDPTWEKLIEALENRKYNFVATMRENLGFKGAYHAWQKLESFQFVQNYSIMVWMVIYLCPLFLYANKERRNPCPTLTLVEIQEHFTQLQKSLRAAITNHIANTKAVINVLLNLPASYCEALGSPLFSLVLLPHKPSVKQVTSLINNFSSFLTYSLIDGCIQDVVKGRNQLGHQLQDYTSLLDGFVSTTTLASFLQQSQGSTAAFSLLPSTQLVQIGLGEAWRYQSIKELMALIDSIVSEVFPTQGLVFQSIYSGKMCSVQTTWLTSTNVVSSFVRALDGQKSALKAKEIVSITIGDISILDDRPTPYPRKQRPQSYSVAPCTVIANSTGEVITSSNESFDSVFDDDCDAGSTQLQPEKPVPKPRKRSPRAMRQSRPFSELIPNPSYMAPQSFSLSEENQQHLSKEFYCQTCSRYLSATCLASGQHRNHSLIPVEENAPQVLRQLTQSLEENNHTEVLARTKSRQISQVLSSIDQAYSAATHNIERFFACVRQKAELRKQELIKAALVLKLDTMRKTSETRNKLNAISDSCTTLKEHQASIMECLQAHSNTGVLWLTDSRKLVCQIKQDLQSCNAQIKQSDRTLAATRFHGDVAMLEQRLEAIGCYSMASKSNEKHHSVHVVTAAAQPTGLSKQTKPPTPLHDSTSEKNTVKFRPLPPTPLDSHICQKFQQLWPVSYEAPLVITQSFPPIWQQRLKKQQMVSSMRIPEECHTTSDTNNKPAYSRLDHSSPSQSIARSQHPVPVDMEISSSAQCCVYSRIGSPERKPAHNDPQSQDVYDSDLHYYSIIDTVEEECYMHMPRENQEPLVTTTEADPCQSRMDAASENLYYQPDEEEDGLNDLRSEDGGSSSSYISMTNSVQPCLVVGRDQLAGSISNQITPIGVCCAGDGHIAFTTAEDSFIRTLDQSRACVDQIISCPFLLPHTLATLSIDGEPAIGVIQKESGEKCQIQVLHTNGTSLKTISIPDIVTPGGMVMDGIYQICVSEERGSISKLSLSGEVLQKIEIPGAGKLGDLISTEHGIMYVTDKIKNCLWVVDRHGGNIQMIGEQFLLGPCSVSLTADNKCIAIVDKIDHTVTIFDRQAEKVQATFGGKGCNIGEFRLPQGVCRRSDGFLVIADTGNHRLQIFSAADIAKYRSSQFLL